MQLRIKALVTGLLLALGAQAAVGAGRSAHDELARDVDRAESMRAVKNLQRTYAQYSHHGLWQEMADLFANDATYIFDEETVMGRKAIGEWLTNHEGSGHQGLKPGEVNAQIIDHPVVNLSVDGESARGR